MGGKGVTEFQNRVKSGFTLFSSRTVRVFGPPIRVSAGLSVGSVDQEAFQVWKTPLGRVLKCPRSLGFNTPLVL